MINMENIFTMDDFDFSGKRVLLRIDINSPIVSGRVQDSQKIKVHSKTIRELVKKKAKVIVLSHQGRPGDKDFLHLDQHAKLLSKHIRKRVYFVRDVFGKKAIQKIRSLKNGDVLLLDNVRMAKDELKKLSAKEFAKTKFIKTLSREADYFINDAFSISHRAQASVVGFPMLLQSAAGRVLENELKMLDGIINKMKKTKRDTFVLGGKKPEEPLAIMENMLRTKVLERVLTCGVVGELFLIARGYNIGNTNMDFLKKNGFLDYLNQVKKLSKKCGKKIETPCDLAVGMKKRKEVTVDNIPDFKIMDIGVKTVKKYSKIIKNSTSVSMKGPAGVYEKKGFERGTRLLLKAIANSKRTTLIGGGHTNDILDKLRISKKKFTHVSLGGGALITYLSGQRLPGLEALKQ